MDMIKREKDFEVKMEGVFACISDISQRHDEPASSSGSISGEEATFLRERFKKEKMKLVEMTFKLTDIDDAKRALENEIEGKNNQIKFLEDDRATFKDMVEDLKAGLMQFGKPSKTVLESVKEESLQRRRAAMADVTIGYRAALSTLASLEDIG